MVFVAVHCTHHRGHSNEQDTIGPWAQGMVSKLLNKKMQQSQAWWYTFVIPEGSEV
jgi:hypothetical protein